MNGNVLPLSCFVISLGYQLLSAARRVATMLFLIVNVISFGSAVTRSHSSEPVTPDSSLATLEYWKHREVDAVVG